MQNFPGDLILWKLDFRFSLLTLDFEAYFSQPKSFFSIIF